MPKKAKGKTGGWPIRQPKWPAPPSSSSDDEDDEMVLIRGLINQMEALEKVKATPSDKGAGPSGALKKVPRYTCGAARTHLLKSISDRLEALEGDEGPSSPVVPADPEDPRLAVPGAPVPVVPLPAAPVLPGPSDPPTPTAPGAGGAAAPMQILVCGHSLVFWAFESQHLSVGHPAWIGEVCLCLLVGYAGYGLEPVAPCHLGSYS
ncbi:non-homologous end joining protein Ku-like isoform X1 [Hemicordylus capensis]|uniref:non-homologous end joining protein Ku-like isoform X1 n=1 Tax=Hemicordylus capensis TaxID=884348 RepID=UPI0023034C41|nr:non-homologous end joining protein Ku-like isoform X1 [Hemicordylus capensis]